MAMSEEIKLDFEVNELQKIKENILITSTKKQIAEDLEYEIEILFPVEKEDILFKLEIFVTRKKIFLFTKNLKPFNDGRDIIGDVFPENLEPLPFSFGRQHSLVNVSTISLCIDLENLISNKEYAWKTLEIPKFICGCCVLLSTLSLPHLLETVLPRTNARYPPMARLPHMRQAGPSSC